MVTFNFSNSFSCAFQDFCFLFLSIWVSHGSFSFLQHSLIRDCFSRTRLGQLPKQPNGVIKPIKIVFFLTFLVKKFYPCVLNFFALHVFSLSDKIFGYICKLIREKKKKQQIMENTCSAYFSGITRKNSLNSLRIY